MYLSFFQPFRFFDPTQIPQNLVWVGISWGIHFALKKLWQYNPIKINRHQIWRNFQWFRISCNAICLIKCMYIGIFMKRIGLGTIEKQLDKIIFFNISHGFSIFKKLEPQAAEYLLNKLKEFVNKNKGS